eukprot:11291473-Karenia_brevis.AAC.1
MEYDVSSFMESCVRTYIELSKGVGYYEIMKPSETPFFAEDHRLADSCRPQNYGHYVECPYCKFTFGCLLYTSDAADDM